MQVFKYRVSLLLSITIVLLFSCGQNEGETNNSKVVVEKKATVQSSVSSSLDSSSIFFKSILHKIENHSSDDYSDIKKEFDNGVQSFERKINSSLNEINEMGKEGLISNVEADSLIIGIQSSEAMSNYQRAKIKLDSLTLDTFISD